MGTNYIQQHFWQKEPIPFFKALDNPSASNIMLISCFNYNKRVNFKCLKNKQWIYYSGERFLSEINADVIISFIPNSSILKQLSINNETANLQIKEVNLTNTTYTYNMDAIDISIKDLVLRDIDSNIENNIVSNTVENNNNELESNIKRRTYIQLRDQEREHIEYILKQLSKDDITPDFIAGLSLYSDLNEKWRETYNKLSLNNADVLSIKPKFCCFIVSNPQCWERNKMFDMLRIITGQKVDSLGKWKRNIDVIIPERGDRDEYLALISQYRFMITFENHSLSWYNTEKIYNAISAGTIPIYWGDPLITELYNPEAFIHVKTKTDKREQITEIISACERIKEIELELASGNNDMYLDFYNSNIVNGAKSCDEMVRNNLNEIYNVFHE